MALLESEIARPAFKGWRCPQCRRASRAHDAMFSLPNNPLIVSAVQALCAGGAHAKHVDGGWRKDKTGAPYFDFWSGSGGRIRVWLDTSNAAAWRDIASFSALTLDVAMILLSSLCCNALRASTRAPRREAFWLGVPAVMYAKGYQRYGAERLEFAHSVEAEIERLLRLRFDIVNYPAFDPISRTWRRDGVTRSGMALLELDEAAAGDPGPCAGALPLRFGEWAEHWLHASGAMWVSPLPEALITLDHRASRGADVLAKKIGVLLALNWGAARHNKQLVTELRALLRRTGELRHTRPDEPHYGGRLADRFEEALLRLSEAGLFHIRPSTTGAELLRAAGRRWFEEWLGAKLIIPRPAFISNSEIQGRAAGREA